MTRAGGDAGKTHEMTENESTPRLDYQPLFGKGARTPPERAAEIEPSPHPDQQTHFYKIEQKQIHESFARALLYLLL